jgi:hypothetical protein
LTATQVTLALFLAFMITQPGNSCGKEKLSNKTKSGNQESSQPSGSSATDHRVPEGKWGGQHVRLEVSADGTDFEFDCAHGRLTGPLLLHNGRFAAKGTYVRERGRVRVDGSEQEQRVYFKGKVEGSQMTLTFSLAEDFSEAEAFTLTRGAGARLVKCK